MGSDDDRKKFIEQVRKACVIGQKLRELGVRPYGVDPHRFGRAA